MLLWNTDGSLEDAINCNINVDIADYLQVKSKLIGKIKATKYIGDLMTKSLKGSDCRHVESDSIKC